VTDGGGKFANVLGGLTHNPGDAVGKHGKQGPGKWDKSSQLNGSKKMKKREKGVKGWNLGGKSPTIKKTAGRWGEIWVGRKQVFRKNGGQPACNK